MSARLERIAADQRLDFLWLLGGIAFNPHRMEQIWAKLTAARVTTVAQKGAA